MAFFSGVHRMILEPRLCALISAKEGSLCPIADLDQTALQVSALAMYAASKQTVYTTVAGTEIALKT